MPELPEVEKARKQILATCLNKTIISCKTASDHIVYEQNSAANQPSLSLPSGSFSASFLSDGSKPKALSKRSKSAPAAPLSALIHPWEIFENMTQGKKMVGAHRKGKHLWLTLNEGPSPTFHFGMTGAILIRGKHAISYKSSKAAMTTMKEKKEEGEEARIKRKQGKRSKKEKEEEQEVEEIATQDDNENEEEAKELTGGDNQNLDSWPPRFWKLLWEFEDGTQFAFIDVRRLGRIRYLENPERHPPISTLGFDPLTSMPSLTEFQDLLGMGTGTGAATTTTTETSPKSGKKSMAIKALLLEQKFSAGVGNYVADEVLYQACIHPEKKMGTLTPTEIQKLHHSLHYVVKEADECHTREEDFPSDWLFHFRWTNRKASKDFYGNSIEFITVGGRTSAVVPAIQKISGYNSEKGFEALIEKRKGGGKPQKKQAEKDSVSKKEEKEEPLNENTNSKRKRNTNQETVLPSIESQQKKRK